jgi:mono/diheme cytochrome c family protein
MLAFGVLNAIGSNRGGGGTAGNTAAGKSLFTSSGCGACHVLAAAGSKGKIGPDLDAVTLTETQIVSQITNGGRKFLTPTLKKQYPFTMTPYKGRLSTTQIQTLAAYVFTVRNAAAGAKAAAASKSSATVSSGGAPPPTYAGGGTTGSGGGGGGGTASSGCPPGVTIQTSHNADADGDELGTEPDDNDGCV